MSMNKRSNGRAALPLRPVMIETLEYRMLMSAAATSASTLVQPKVASAAFLAAAQPSVTSSDPASGGTLDRDGFVALSVRLVSAGNGIDASTLQDNVLMNRI